MTGIMPDDKVLRRMDIDELRKTCHDVGYGLSVTHRVTVTRQPRGGYVPPKTLTVVSLGDGIEVLNAESISPSLMGTSVDYITRHASGDERAFDLAMRGAMLVDVKEATRGRMPGNDVGGFQDNMTYARWLLENVRGDDDASITNAVRLSNYDTMFRSGHFMPSSLITVDHDTCENIRTMVGRSLAFLREYGPVVLDGFCFPHGYTDVVSSGDGDYVTRDALIDFKVSKNPPTKEHTLQLLMYWRMGLHSTEPAFQDVTRLGTYNPRRNEYAYVETSDIPQDTIDAVEHNVIGYE